MAKIVLQYCQQAVIFAEAFHKKGSLLVPALHFHNCLEIALYHGGSGTLEFWDPSYRFKAGNLTPIGSEMPHTTYSSPGPPVNGLICASILRSFSIRRKRF